MIIDTIRNASIYFPLSERLAAALRFLQETDLVSLQPGKYEIDGANVYATIQESITKPMEQGFWEAHRKYIDIHYVIEGMERIGYANIERLKAGQYDEEKDFQVLEGEGEYFTLTPGFFVIMAPRDAHKPGIAVNGVAPVKKLVIKISSLS
jgi:YhcH/YjgK/YiaL family protein